MKLTAPRSHWCRKIKAYFLLTSSSDWVFSGQPSMRWLEDTGSYHLVGSLEWFLGIWPKTRDVVLLFNGQVCISHHVHHVPVSRTQTPWPKPNCQGGWETQSSSVSWPRNGTGEQRASLCLTPGEKTLKVGCTTQVRWLACSCSLPWLAGCSYVQRTWGTGTLTRKEGQILAVNLQLLVAAFSNRLRYLLVSLPAISYPPSLPPQHAFSQFREVEHWVSLPSTSTDTEKTYETLPW